MQLEIRKCSRRQGVQVAVHLQIYATNELYNVVAIDYLPRKQFCSAANFPSFLEIHNFREPLTRTRSNDL